MAYIYVLEFSDSSTKKREISKAIVELNKKRRESGVSELHFMFKRLIEQGEIDPELMLYGVNELAEDLQQQDDKLASAQDSLKLLTAQVDSLKNLQPENSKSKNKTNSDSGMIWGIVFGLIGLIIGVIIASISIKRKNNSLKSDTFS